MGVNKYDKETELKICDEYISGLSMDFLAKKYNLKSIFKLLKRYNIKTRNISEATKMFSDTIELEITSRYLKGENTLTLAKKYKCSQDTIRNTLKRQNVKIKSMSESRRKYTLDENYFNIIDSPDKAWILGWWYSDGCNHSNRSDMSIGLEETDKDILEIIKKYMETDIPLMEISKKSFLNKNVNKIYISQRQYRLTINSQKLSDALTRLGCVPAKSLILKFPTPEQVPEYLLSHFIRGYLEGDGSIGFKNNLDNKLKIDVIGTKEFLEELKNWLVNKGIELINIYKKDAKINNNTYLLRINSILDILKFKELIYDNYFNKYSDGDLFLQRKYNKFLEIQQYVNNNKGKIERLHRLREIHKPQNEQIIIDKYVINKLSMNQIAKQFGVVTSVIKKIIKKNNNGNI